MQSQNATLDKPPLTFPCQFPLKIMGRATDDFVTTIVQIVKQFDPGFDSKSIELKPSRLGVYLGVTLTVTASSRAQLDELYRALCAEPLVKVVL